MNQWSAVALLTLPALVVSAPFGCVPEIPQPGLARAYVYEVINVYPHDPAAFTQGLIYHGGVLYEGTGLNGQSSLRRVSLETGQVLQQHNLARDYFGEGITLFENRIIQLTWRSNVGFVYDYQTFELLDTFEYAGEGWGITHDGARLIMSDGTASLRFLDPETFEELGRISVHDTVGPVTRLNELEFIHGKVYANVWLTDNVAIIDPATGEVVSWVNLDGILPPEDDAPGVDVLNGIAHDPATDRLFITGKRWPKLFEIDLVPVTGTR